MDSAKRKNLRNTLFSSTCPTGSGVRRSECMLAKEENKKLVVTYPLPLPLPFPLPLSAVWQLDGCDDATEAVSRPPPGSLVFPSLLSAFCAATTRVMRLMPPDDDHVAVAAVIMDPPPSYTPL